MNTQNLKTFPGFIIETELTNGYRAFNEEFDHAYGLMSLGAEDDVSEIEVARAVLNFPAEPDEAEDDVVSVTPVNNLFRTWIFQDLTAEQFGKIVVAAKLGLLSSKDAQAADAKFLELFPYPADPTYTIVAETKSGEQVIVRAPECFE